MGFTSLESSSIAAGKALPYTMMAQIKNNEDFLYGKIAGGMETGYWVYNGGFEVDADGNGQPDGWTITPYTGGGSTLVTTATTWISPIHGGKSLCITRPSGAGNGGAVIQSDYFPASTNDPIYVHWLQKSNATGVHIQGKIEGYNKNRVYLGDVTPYDSTSMATTTERIRMIVSMASLTSCCWARVRLNVGCTDLGSSGAVLLDDMQACPVDGRPIPITINPTSGGTTEYTWQDVSTLSITMPYSNAVVMAALNIQLTLGITYPSTIWDAGSVGQIRLKHFSDFSSIAQIASSDGLSATSINILPFRFVSTAGPQSVQFQAMLMSLLPATWWHTLAPTISVSNYSSRASITILAVDI
jgi:hypothetical protein